MQDFSDQIIAIRSRVNEARGYLRIDELEMRQPQLEAEASRPDLWDDQEKARKVTSELARVNEDLELYSRLSGDADDAATLHEMAREEDDESLELEIAEALGALETQLEELEMRALFTGEFDEGDAVCQIKSGEGGTDAQDWAEMLMRMYSRWAERRGFSVEVMDLQPAEEGGIKSATLEINGESAYGFLKAEGGVHRLVRISPFDAQSRRHTSFASVFIYPQVDDDIEIEIDEGDLRVDTYRASGAGGQHVNKTDSAVRFTHGPTGIVVACQQERSQHKNRATAMKMLRAALYQHALLEKEKERAVLEATKQDIGWGSQIRSYVFQPYTMVNDHRTELKLTDVQRVMDGDLDPFIEAYLKMIGAPSED